MVFFEPATEELDEGGLVPWTFSGYDFHDFLHSGRRRAAVAGLGIAAESANRFVENKTWDCVRCSSVHERKRKELDDDDATEAS